MNPCQVIRTNIKKIDAYLANYQAGLQQSAALEVLFSKSMSYIFHVPFFTVATNKTSVLHKVVWNGEKEVNPVAAPGGGSDAIVFARNFDVLLEITLNTGARQWDREFSRSVRHFEEYIRTTQKDPDSVQLVLIVREIHVDTYNAIRHKVNEGLNIVILRFRDIEKILEVCNIAIGLRHFDLTQLFGTFARTMQLTQSLATYDRKATRIVSEWRKDFLRHDQLAYVAIKSYNLIKAMDMSTLDAAYIASELNTQKEVKTYFKILGETVTKKYVCDGMLIFGFACETGIPQPNPILTIVSKMEIEKRIEEILANIEKD